MTWSIVDAARDGLATFALNWLIQSSALLIVGLLAGLWFRRKGAAVQSLVYRTNLAAILLCPIASALFASVGLGGFWVQFPPRPTRLVERRVESNRATASIVDGSRRDRDKLVLPAKAAPQSVPSSMDQPTALVLQSPAPARRAVVPVRAVSLPHWADFVSAMIWIGLGLWLSVSFLLLSRLVWGYRQLARIRSSAIPADGSTIALCRELADRMKRDAPDVRLSPFLSSPCLFGVRRPTILLTEEDASGKCEVLLHELAHLVRRDSLWNLLRQVACDLVWFQPLVWVLSRRLETTAEEVCDDVVVHFGADRSSYADQLVSIAERMLAPVAPAGVGIVAPRSSLTRRVRRILDASRPLSIRSTRSGSAAIVAIGLVGTLLVALVGVGRPAPAAGVASSRPQLPRNEIPPGQTVSFTGRLIDRESGKPVAGATIVVECTVPGCPPDKLPAGAGATTLRSDAEGRFTLAFTPEQVAEPRAAVTFRRVEHPDYVALRSMPALLVNLVRDRHYGSTPFFETIRLDRGVDYSAEVVTPEGRPAVGVHYEMYLGWRGTPLGSPSRQQEEWLEIANGVTNEDGRIRHRLDSSASVILNILPEAYSVFTKPYGSTSFESQVSGKPPLPPDLGPVALEPGCVVTGRLVGLDGRPLAGQRLAIDPRRDRTTITEADGSFRFPPIPRAWSQCCVVAPNQVLRESTAEPVTPFMTGDQPVIARSPVIDLEADPVETVELREVPSVRLEMQFVDSKGRPASGCPVMVVGAYPGEAGEADDKELADPEAERRRQDRLNLENRPWACRVAPDAEGRVSVRVPRGLNNTTIWVDEESNSDETLVFQVRLAPGDPAQDARATIAGPLEADQVGIEFVVRRSPTVLARVETDDGTPVPESVWLQVEYVDLSPNNFTGSGSHGIPTRCGPTRFRTRNLLPGQEYEFFAFDPGRDYRPKAIVRRTLAEGVEEEIAVVLTRKRATLKVGDHLPEFSVTTTTRERWNVSDHRGRFVLLSNYIYSNNWFRSIADLSKRVGPDRLDIITLWAVPDPARVAKAEHEAGVNWPQALLPDRYNTPLLWDLGLHDRPGSPGVCVLIDPEGMIRSFSFDAAEIQKAITGGD